MIGGLGQIDGQSFMIVGQTKRNTKMRQYRNSDGKSRRL
jgi:acetyl-CoA carboxylase carboxyl transferase subunit alpha